jgi:hypothetical protein
MYFVTMKREGYVLFCMSPSERFALGLTASKMVHLLERSGTEWKLVREWPSAEYSHTALMSSLRWRPEPKDAGEWIGLLPEPLR